MEMRSIENKWKSQFFNKYESALYWEHDWEMIFQQVLKCALLKIS